ncbi:hypothetical protein LOTGIDRAFT_165684 [Lottia gigantea]|uniref:EGF-like domain-containing protein n=1 Tax=Lottia gigantea TaxID=225164 RepID=V4A4Q7_LOTGI|nr:hypothetical protein LOTGIDRAFT_165684 [Lottia gigantea]ESO88251.1 hypothetical protein LOTGIDRAFT_165684 [Lottia gigantea]
MLFSVIIVVFTSLLNSSIVSSEDTDIDNICYKACNNESKGFLEEHCTGVDLTLNNSHCCFNTSSSRPRIIGIDLRGCDISTIKALDEVIESLIVISLEDNPIKSDLNTDFNGLRNAVYLSLPPSLDCPGDNEAWESIEKSNTSTICHNQIDTCLHFNISCPANSECKNTGPGTFECDCLTGYHGYKCLNKGKFPAAYYGIGFAVTTVGLSTILWILQRRHVIKRTD